MAKRFKWRLDSVKKAKERHEDARKQALGEAQSAQNTEERALDDLRTKRREQTDRLKSNQSGRLDAQALQAAHEYISELGEKIDAQQEKVDAARALTESRRADLVRAVQENKVLENLRTRDRDAFRKAERRREQAETDETAGRRTHRNQNKEESEQ